MVYNAKSKKGRGPELQSQLTLFKNGKEYFRGKPEKIDQAGIKDFGGIPIAKRLVFTDGMEEGLYLMQIMVKDGLAKKKLGMAFQAIDFQIRKDSTNKTEPPLSDPPAD